MQTLLAELGSHAKDIKLNLTILLTPEGAPDLSQEQIYGIALACAYATKKTKLIDAIENESKLVLTQAHQHAAKAAATVMAMNNVYYRFVHLVSNKEYAKLPAKLRMNTLANPGINKVDFELYALGISAINGCGMCMDAHVNQIASERISMLGIQSCIRIAAVINATAQGLI